MKLLKKVLCFVLVAIFISSNQVYALEGNETSLPAKQIIDNKSKASQIKIAAEQWSNKINNKTRLAQINSTITKPKLTASASIPQVKMLQKNIPVSCSGEYINDWFKNEKVISKPQNRSLVKSNLLSAASSIQYIGIISDLETPIINCINQRQSALNIIYTGYVINEDDLNDRIINELDYIFSTDDYLNYSTNRVSFSCNGYVGNVTIQFNLEYLTDYNQEQYVTSTVNNIINQIITADMNAYKREKAIHDYIVSHVQYQIDLNTAYSALYYGETNCLGYALLTYKMCKAAGLEVRIIDGEAGGGGHAWNMIKLAGNWYQLDCCWDDPVPDVAGRIIYDYYNLSDNQMGVDHTWNHSLYPACTVIFDRSVVDTAVTFPDSNLNSLIHELLNKKASDTIFLSDVLNITYIDGSDRQISNLDGMQYLTNLEELYLYNNNINNISVLSRMTKLGALGLDSNNISDFSPLSNMKGLTFLSLTNNKIADISVLAGLTNLETLYLDNNQIANISPITNLTNLVYLNLNENLLTDITPVSNLTNLTNLDASDNKIEDIKPVSYLLNLSRLGLGSNTINDIKPISSLKNLNQLFLINNYIQNIEPIKGLTNLTDLYLSYNLITDIRPLSELTNITTLYLSGNPIMDYSPIQTYYANLAHKDFDINKVNNIVHLDDIKVNGVSIEGFSKYNDKYDVILPEGSGIPNITYTASNPDAEVSLLMPTELPGTAIIEAKSLDKEWSITYEVSLYVTETLKVDNNKLIGGTDSDVANKIEPTYDGGYVIAGYTKSNDGDISGSHGGQDAFITKVDASDNIEWTKCYGGGNDDYFNDIKQTPDGGYIAVGFYYLHDVEANSADTETMAWIVKTDKSGNVQWEKKNFENGFNSLKAVFTAPDGGYYIAGDSISQKGDKNIGIIKLKANGDEEWNHSYGGAEHESLQSIDRTLDNGFIMSALSSTNKGDCFVQKIDALGNSLWYKYYIGSQFDEPASIKSTPDGGYLMALTTCSNDYDMADNKNTNYNRCVIKINDKGEKEWANFDGKGYSDLPNGLYVFKDGCSLLYGTFFASEWDSNVDTYLTKLSPQGKIISDTVIKGNNYDFPKSILVKGNKYILAGYTTSTDLGTVNKGSYDIWLSQLTSSFTYKNNENDITVFSLGAQIEPTAVDTVNHVVSVKVYKGTSLASVTPVIGVSPGASISYTSGTAINLSTDTVFTVTAEDGSEQDWTIKPVYVARTNPRLSNISVNGTTIKGFSPETLHYEVELPYGTTKVPFVYAQAQDATTIINLNKAVQIPGTTTIRTYAQDITKSLTYTIDFKVGDSPMIDWQNIFTGNEQHEYPVGIENTPDGGYITVINTIPYNSQNYGNDDILVIKYDKNNNIEWKKCFGGRDEDYAYSLTQAPDGGYVIAGKTLSWDGDLQGVKSGPGYGGWIFKIDSVGNIVWNKCVDGTSDDSSQSDESFQSVVALKDGSYIAVGEYAANSHSINNYGNAWLVKFSAKGELEWERNFGGSEDDQFSSVVEADDGGFIAAGKAGSIDGDVQGHSHNLYIMSNYDGWIVKFNSSGEIVWQKCLGGTDDEIINSIVKTNDGKIIGVGYAESYSREWTGYLGNDRGWILKFNSNGDIEENKVISGTGYQGFSFIRRLPSGGFIALGDQYSEGDANVYKFDDNINSVWKKPVSNCLTNEYRGGIIQRNDGSYIAVTSSYADSQYDAAITHIEKDTPSDTTETKDECFIATAAYGSKYMPAVSLLRKFRDKFLLTNSIGTEFVKFYYKNSPPIADYIRDRGYLRTIVRILLTPLIMIAYLLFHPEGLIPLVVVFIFNWRMRRRRMNS